MRADCATNVSRGVGPCVSASSADVAPHCPECWCDGRFAQTREILSCPNAGNRRRRTEGTKRRRRYMVGRPGHRDRHWDAPAPTHDTLQTILGLSEGRLKWTGVEACQTVFCAEAMTMPNHLHMNFNLLEEGFKASQTWLPFQPVFLELVRFCGDKLLTQRFIQCNMRDSLSWEKQMCRSYSGHTFERRCWGLLVEHTKQRARLWPIFVKFWDMDKLTADGHIQAATPRYMNRALKNETGDVEAAELIVLCAECTSRPAITT